MPDSKGNLRPNEAAEALGIGASTLRRYLLRHTLPEPDHVLVGTTIRRSYSAIWLANARKILSKIAEERERTRTRPTDKTEG